MLGDKRIDWIWLYILWKLSNINIPIQNKFKDLSCFKTINYYFRKEKDKIYVDDFLELSNIDKTEIYISYLIYYIQSWLIKELHVYIEEEIYKPELVLKIDKNFIEKYNYIIPFNHWDTKEEKDYIQFIRWYYSIREIQILNNIPVNKNLPNYKIYYWYKLNLDKVNLYIQEYLLNWWKELLTSEENYIKPSKQIQYFSNYLIDYINNFRDEFKYNIWVNKNLDEITLILYFNILWYIELIWFNDWVDRIIGLNNTSIIFRIKILQKFYEDFTKKEWLYFNDKSWDVILDWNIVWSIPLETQPYHFFKFLYDNRWEVKLHKEIKEYIKWKDSIQKWNDEFCRNIKNELPNKEIKKLIKSSKGWYRIP